MSRGLLAISAYGAGMLGVGVLAVMLPVTSAAPPGPVLEAAPVVAPVLPAPTGTGTPSASSAPPVAGLPDVPDAAVGQVRGVVDAFRPSRLVLSGGVRARVVPAGVRRDGSLVVPENPDVVGWWTGGAAAGDAFGSTVIAGHVDSAQYGLGAMFALTTAHRGDVVTLQAGGRSQRYRVRSVRKVKKADLADDPAIFAVDGPHRLVLITCGGRFDRVAHRYADNVIVEAVPVRAAG